MHTYMYSVPEILFSFYCSCRLRLYWASFLTFLRDSLVECGVARIVGLFSGYTRPLFHFLYATQWWSGVWLRPRMSKVRQAQKMKSDAISAGLPRYVIQKIEHFKIKCNNEII